MTELSNLDSDLEIINLAEIDLTKVKGNTTTNKFIEDLNNNFNNIKKNTNDNFGIVKTKIEELNDLSQEAKDLGENAKDTLDNIKERVSEAGNKDGWRYRKWIKTEVDETGIKTVETSYELWARVKVLSKTTTSIALPDLDGLYSDNGSGNGRSKQYYILTTPEILPPTTSENPTTIAADIIYSNYRTGQYRHYVQLFAGYSGSATVYIWIKVN